MVASVLKSPANVSLDTLKAVDTSAECAQVVTFVEIPTKRTHMDLAMAELRCYGRASMPNQVTLPSFNYLRG
jgi:hypothetical protein